jgi:hypothetical protein
MPDKNAKNKGLNMLKHLGHLFAFVPPWFIKAADYGIAGGKLIESCII